MRRKILHQHAHFVMCRALFAFVQMLQGGRQCGIAHRRAIAKACPAQHHIARGPHANAANGGEVAFSRQCRTPAPCFRRPVRRLPRPRPRRPDTPPLSANSAAPSKRRARWHARAWGARACTNFSPARCSISRRKDAAKRNVDLLADDGPAQPVKPRRGQRQTQAAPFAEERGELARVLCAPQSPQHRQQSPASSSPRYERTPHRCADSFRSGCTRHHAPCSSSEISRTAGPSGAISALKMRRPSTRSHGLSRSRS